MGFEYKVKDQGAMYFVTFTVHQWIDVFTRKIYVDILLDNLEYCQKEKGLEIFAWVVMSNHCHLIIRAKNNDLSSIIRDFKKFTAKKIYRSIKENANESRKEWLQHTLSNKGNIWFWNQGYHGKEIINKSFCDSKVEYIHFNPVKAGLVEKEEDYLWSSAGDFCGVRKGRLKLDEL